MATPVKKIINEYVLASLRAWTEFYLKLIMTDNILDRSIANIGNTVPLRIAEIIAKIKIMYFPLVYDNSLL